MEGQTLQKKVLVVDDEISVRCFVIDALREYFKGEVTIMMADNYSQASDTIIHCTRPDIIISDVEMPPGGTGWNLADFIRRQPDPKISGIPFILMSGDGNPDNEEKAKKRGLYFIYKPFGPAQIFDVLNKILEA